MYFINHLFHIACCARNQCRPQGSFPCLWRWALSKRFGHPRVLGIPIPKSLAFWASPSHITAAFWASPGTLPGCPNPWCFGYPLQKNSGLRGKIENVSEMDSAIYRNLFQYLKLEMNEAGVGAGYFQCINFSKKPSCLRLFCGEGGVGEGT